jgi:hypothetical protein
MSSWQGSAPLEAKSAPHELLINTTCPPRSRSRAPSFCSQPCGSSVVQMASVQQDSSKASADAPPAENGQVPAGEDEWDEERLEKAMKTLKEMHIQVRTPRLITIALSLIYAVVARLANHNPKASCTTNNQATLTYVRHIPSVTIIRSPIDYT